MRTGRRWRIKTRESFSARSFRGSRFAGRQVKVKICGIMDTATALAAVEAGADALGFVFAASRRRVTPEAARDIIRRLPPFVSRVGVFVNTPPDEVADIAAYCGLSIIQLSSDSNLTNYSHCNNGFNEHINSDNVTESFASNTTANGTDNETAYDTCTALANLVTAQSSGTVLPGCPLDCARCSGQKMGRPAYKAALPGKPLHCNLPVLKTIRVGDGRGISMWPGCQAAAFLFDTYKAGSYGGTGETFDWQVLPNINCPKPVILAGGLTAANVQDAIKLVKPYAVDVSGGVETDGCKDVHKIKEFISQAKGVLI